MDPIVAASAAAPVQADSESLIRNHGWYGAVILLFAVAGACILFTPPATFGSWLWVVAVFVVGMPHGAYDLAAIQRTSSGWRHVVKRFFIYTLVLLACLGFFLVFPVIAVSCFFLLASHHFGISDSVWTRGRIDLALGDHLAGFGRGLIVLFCPLAFQPSASAEPFVSIINLVRQMPDPPLGVIAMVAAAFAVTGGVLVLIASFRTSRGGQVQEWATLAAVVMLSAFAPPLVAIGSYFLIVHASGHCSRAMIPGRPAQGRPFANAVRVHRESAALLVPSVIIVLIVATIFPGTRVDAVAASFLLFCVIATLPHHLLWMTSNRWS